MLCIRNGNVLGWKEGFKRKDILIEGKKITGLADRANAEGCECIDAEGLMVLPGFIDIHNHGAYGHEVMDGTYEALNGMSAFYASKGVTGFLAATSTSDIESILKALANIKETMERGTSGAKLLGANVEGPFINPRFKGAHREELIIGPTAELVDAFLDASGGNIRLMTIAPEENGAMEIVKTYKDRITFSAGHSGISYGGAVASFENGISHITHLFNAMRGFHHREPGLLGAALDSEKVVAELICDGVHVHPAAIKMAVKLKGPEKIALITDSTMATGMPEEDFMFANNQRITVKNGEVRLKDGTLAGSVLTMDQAVRNMVNRFGVSLIDAARMASRTPAEAIGLGAEKGSIETGMDADLVLLDSNLAVRMTIVEGKVVYRA